MNEEKNVISGDKPRKKKRSLWWLWFLLILAAFAGGCVTGLKINTLPLPTEVRDRLYPLLESYIPGSTTPHSSEDVTVTSEPTVVPEAAPALTVESSASVAETSAPEKTAVTDELASASAEETSVPVETPASVPTETPETARMSDTAVFETAESAKKYIGVGAALEIALKHAEIEEADAEITGVYRTKDENGEPVYEVGFTSNELTYEYVIDALDGEIVGWKMSGFTFSDTAAYAADFSGNDISESKVTEPPVPAALIGEDNAKEIAYNHAAVKPAEVIRASVNLDSDIYNVEFKTASRKFNYTIDAHTGEVLSDEVTK